MSTYENYSEASRHYDKTRVPIGAEILIGVLARLRRSRSGLGLLDAGCGTGAYSELVLPHVERIDAMDINPDMLAAAREKLANNTSDARVTFHQGSIKKMPFEAAYFDAVMFNQVLHHLESGQGGGFDGHQTALAEAHRVLRSDGLVVVNCTTHEQLRRGYWYMHLIPTELSDLGFGGGDFLLWRQRPTRATHAPLRLERPFGVERFKPGPRLLSSYSPL